jgi:hypothetical protein
MNKLILIALFILAFAEMGISQNKAHRLLSVVTLTNRKQIMTRDLILGPKEVASFKILNSTEVTKYYKNKNADIVIKSTPKSGIILLGLAEILDLYKVEPKFRNFSVLIEDSAVYDQNNILAIKSFIKAVVIDENKKTINILSQGYESTVAFRKEDKGVIHNRINPLPVHQ